MGGGFEFHRESFEGSVKRYRNSRLEVTVRDYDDYDGSWDPEQVVITAKTIKFSGMKYAIAPAASGLLITGSSDFGTYCLSLRAIDRLTGRASGMGLYRRSMLISRQAPAGCP